MLLTFYVGLNRDTYRDPRPPWNVICYLNDGFSVHVEEYSSFRSYVIALRPLENLCLSMAVSFNGCHMHGKYTTGREDTPSILPRK